ncbi:transmembrane protein [Cricetulus griseus]|nr:transmembrane protein [Cricetulus griseus]
MHWAVATVAAVTKMEREEPQTVTLWVFDPESSSKTELQRTATKPSMNSRILTKLLNTLGQQPSIHTTVKRRVYVPGALSPNGTWDINLPMSSDDLMKEVRGNKVAFQDCFISNLKFLLTFPRPTIPETSGDLPLTLPAGRPLLSTWGSCNPTFTVLVTDYETFQSNDSFRTWTRIRVPPGILSDAERHNVTDVALFNNGIMFLINGVIYLKTEKTFTKLDSSKGLPTTEIIGITRRRWCQMRYLFKSEKRKSILAIWTKSEFYLGFSAFRFMKVIDSSMLKAALKLSPAATVVIESVEYTWHPLELALVVYYCAPCTTTKSVRMLLYNEDSGNWAFQDFQLALPVDSNLVPYFLYSALPDLILWDAHTVYYYYKNFTITGIIRTETGERNLSKLSQGSKIHNVIIGNLFSHPQPYPSSSSFLLLPPSCLVFVVAAALLLTLSISKIKAPSGMNSSEQSPIHCPHKKHYGPKILTWTQKITYEIASGFSTKSVLTTFYQTTNYELVDDYFKLEEKNMGLMLIQFRPSEFSKTCPIARQVFEVAVGCDSNKYIQVKGFTTTGCQRRDFSYVIDKEFLRDSPPENLKIRYDVGKYGCPKRLEFHQMFHPIIELPKQSSDFSKSGCINEAQTLKAMMEQNQGLPLDDVWGPQNYKPCFSYAIGKPGDLSQPYEILNRSNKNHLQWPMDHSGMYVFRVKILDPNFSFCNLTAIFAIETFGVIPRPSFYLVAALIFVLMLTFISILILSYFWYMRIYRQFIFEPLHKPPTKQKKH